MTGNTKYQFQINSRLIKRLIFLLLTIVLISACEKEPKTGNLFISTEFEGIPEDNVDCWLYESLDKFARSEFLQKELSDEYGEAYFDNLEPGWYIVEARKVKSSMFVIYAADSVEIEASKRTNKILIMYQLE